MHRRLLRFFSLLLCCLLLAPGLAAAELIAPYQPISVEMPPLTPDGYLQDETEGAEFVHVNVKGGEWLYLSANLRVEIRRYKGKIEGRNTVWFVSDVKAKDGMAFRSFQESPDKPGKRARPEQIAQKHRVVYAQNGDLWTWRLQEKRYPGLIIRDGKIVQDKTYKKTVDAIPSLDELALYPDGRMEVRYPSEINSAQYLEDGAHDVFAFGPVLIRDGVLDERLKTSFKSAQPRSAIGMIEPGHYVGVMIEGRTKRSYGTSLGFVANILMERGCQLAFNLDGGQTSAMVFMGSLVMHEPTYNGFTNTRNQPDIIGIGTSPNAKARRK